MGISPLDVERALEGVNELALPALGAICLYRMLYRSVSAAVSSRPAPAALPWDVQAKGPGPSRFVRRGLSLLGIVVGLGSPTAAGERPPSRRTPLHAVESSALRSEPGRFPPPRLPGPAEPPVDARRRSTVAPPWADPQPDGPPRREATPAQSPNAARHPAVHGGGARPGGRLFQRSDGERVPPLPPRDNGRSRGRWHAVLPGETLWSIAADRLGTDDIRRIARYWPKIHRANRDEVGPNPDLIRPGQVLELPPERA